MSKVRYICQSHTEKPKLLPKHNLDFNEAAAGWSVVFLLSADHIQVPKTERERN